MPKYVLNDNVTEKKLLDAGFEQRYGVWNIQKSLYGKGQINLAVTITDDFMREAVTGQRGEIYAPMYNPALQHHNLVYEQVNKNYQAFMNGLVKKKILRKEKERKERMDGKRITIKYFTDKITKLDYIDGKSDWIDLRAAEEVHLKKGEFKLIPLGVAMQLPEGYEAHVVPRSSTFKNFGVIQANSVGIIDNSYSGNDDMWQFPAYAVRDTVIHVNDRICQFRIVKNQPKITFDEVEHLSGKNRGGWGSTGKQ